MTSSPDATPTPLSPPVLYILLAVADRDRHGYAIMKEVTRRTGGRARLLPGSLYSTIKRMVDDGLIEEVEARRDDDERRRYYRITPEGREAAAVELERMAALMRFADGKELTSEPGPGSDR